MKAFKIISFLFLIMLLFPLEEASASEININKINNYDYKVINIRAGGLTGGASTTTPSHSHTRRGRRYYNSPLGIVSSILNVLLFIMLISISSIYLYFKVLRASINNKRYLKILAGKDVSWKYKNIEKQVIKCFYIVQESWTNGKIEQAKNYMDSDLYDSFKTKLNWMEVSNRKNILKNIKLLNLKPVSIYDDDNDDKDLIWFYIKGRMIDYIIDTNSNEKIEGNTFNKSFVEFWKFTRKEDKWILTEILQENESNKIQF